MIEKNKIIKSLQRGMINETLTDSAYIDIKIAPVNIDKAILIFNSTNYYHESYSSFCCSIGELIDCETVRVYGGKLNPLSNNTTGLIVPRCTWQVIEFY